MVLQLTIVCPVLVQTREEAQRLFCQQIVGSRSEVVSTQIHAIVEQTGLQAKVSTACGLPLNLCITDTSERKSCNSVQELCTAEIAAGSIVIDIVVTADVITGSQTQEVNGLDL